MNLINGSTTQVNEKVLGEVKYALIPVRFSAQEVENKFLYRDDIQIMRNNSGQSFLINVTDCSEVTNCDIDNNLVFYHETILIEMGSDLEATMKLNSLNVNMPYIHLYDLENNSYTFAIHLIEMDWSV